MNNLSFIKQKIFYFFKKNIKNYINFLAYKTDHFADMKIIDQEFGEIYEKCVENSKTTKMSMYAIYKSIEYISKNGISGDIVECGVWKGSSAIMILNTLIKMNDTNRRIYLYDTYEGMVEPTKEDVFAPSKRSAIEQWKKNKFKHWGDIDFKEVKKRILSTGYPKDRIFFIKGMVEETIPKTMPERIAFLRLDTDWYKSTKHELKNLYPLLSRFGVLNIDDYGYWSGAKKATDEFFKDRMIFLNRIDQTGRIGIKI